MSSFKRFETEGVVRWIDTDKVTEVVIRKSVVNKTLFYKGDTVWNLSYFMDNNAGTIPCWCEELAVNYGKMLTGTNS